MEHPHRIAWARPVILSLCAFAAIAAVAEAVARIAGVADYPLYRRSSTVGYIPAPSQHGAFLDTRRWVFNERSMGIAQPFRPTAQGTLLIGDSIVYGGNPIDQADRLGPRIATLTDCRIWPIAAASWALTNEIREIATNSDFLSLGTIVVVSNSADFGEASVWKSEEVHPTRHAASAMLYALKRKLWPVNDNTPSIASDAANAEWKRQLAWLSRTYHGRIVWVIYPTKDELRAPSPSFDDLLRQIRGRATIIDVANDPRWTDRLYRDSIHPSADGYRTLAAIIADRLPRCNHRRDG